LDSGYWILDAGSGDKNPVIFLTFGHANLFTPIMTPEEKADIELIERYIHDQLSHSEAVDFETRLDEDREFARKVRLRKAFPSLFNAEGDDEISEATVEVPETGFREEKTGFFRAKYMIPGLVFALIAGIILYFIFIRTNTSGTKTVVESSPAKEVAKVVKPEPLPQSSSKTAPSDQQNESTITSQPMNSLNKPFQLDIPADNAVFDRKGDILFRWKQETDSFTNFYIFSDGSDQLVWWRGIRPGLREYRVPAINFKPGTFYWYVGTKDVRRTLIIKE